MNDDFIEEGRESGGEIEHEDIENEKGVSLLSKYNTPNTPRDEPSSRSQTRTEGGNTVSDGEDDHYEDGDDADNDSDFEKNQRNLVKKMMAEINSNSQSNLMRTSDVSNKDVMREDVRVVKETRMKALRTTGYRRKEFSKDHAVVYNDLQLPINPKTTKKRT